MAGAYDWDTSASLNTSVGGVNVAEGSARANSNDADRAIMAGVKTYILSTGSVLADGAAGDGVADDTSEIAAAIARAGVNGRVYFPSGLYKISSTIDILEGQTLVFDNARFTPTVATLTMFRANGVNNWSILGRGRLIGARTSETSGTGVGLLVNNAERYRVEGLTAEKIVGIGFNITGSTSPTFLGEQGQFTDCAAFECCIGRSCIAGTGAEYTTWVNFRAVGNRTGVEDSAGNAIDTGSNITDNTLWGMVLTGGANHGHGIASACNINHNGDPLDPTNTGNVRCVSVTNGYTFDGCHFYETGISLESSKSIKFLGGILDTVGINMVTPAGDSFMENMDCPGTSIPVNSARYLIFRGMTGAGAVTAGGVSINDPSELYVHGRRLAGGGTQAVSSATTLIFNDVQSNGDRREALNDATGVVTVPKGGQYRLRAHLTFTVTDSTVAGSFVAFQVNAATVSEAFVGSLYSTTLLSFIVDREIYLNAADTIKLQATLNGTTPLFGHATYDSWFSLEKIA